MLILASASKARRELLSQVEIEHQVIVSDIDESEFSGTDVRELVSSLASAKSKSVSTRIMEKKRSEPGFDKVLAVLGCDSLFEFNGEVFGKPKDSLEAIKRWKRMSSNTGVLHTGHSLRFRNLLYPDLRSVEFVGVVEGVVSTRINFAEVSDMEIEAYVETNEPLKCAGGFAIEGIGAPLIESIEGCYSNVIGLSLPWLRKALYEVGLFVKN